MMSKGDYQEYSITSFVSDHELKEEIVKIIEGLHNNFYLNTNFDMWKLLFKYLDDQIAML